MNIDAEILSKMLANRMQQIVKVMHHGKYLRESSNDTSYFIKKFLYKKSPTECKNNPQFGEKQFSQLSLRQRTSTYRIKRILKYQASRMQRPSQIWASEMNMHFSDGEITNSK